MALPLLDEYSIDCVSFGGEKAGALHKLSELATRDYQLWRYAKHIGANIIVALGGIFAAHAALLARIPSIIFYDTEIARLQNLLTYPIATKIVVPRCYYGWTPKNRTLRYSGYHELSYLHPARFIPNKDRALASGLSKDVPTYLLRFVSWTANHDIGDSGLTTNSIRDVITRLKDRGEVIISSERALPSDLKPMTYKGRVSDIHHLMAFCSGYFGESATMASECAILGVPSVYAATSKRGYTIEQEEKYGLVKNVHDLHRYSLLSATEWLLTQDTKSAQSKRKVLLSESIDVAAYIAETVNNSIR